ncbi:MAG TPA: hypothetical protein VEC56_04745 [Candidatus Krumholzibacteria bacterium]|nr:hypothetical protein [Candidatus Krumholzibacteria bacterium]
MTDAIVAAILGGLIAIAGGFVAAWFQLRIARRTRMHAIIAEKKVKANAEAYQYMKEIERSLIQRSDEETLLLLNRHDAWLAANRLFLPGSFPEKWTSLRITLQWLVGSPMEGPRDPDTAHRLRLKALRLAKEALAEVYEDMEIEDRGGTTINDE